MNVQAPTGLSTNGDEAPPGSREDEAITSLRWEIERRQFRVDELKAELAEVEPGLKRYRKALALLTGEAPERPTRTSAPTKARASKDRKGVSHERLNEIEQTIRQFAADHDEFRQIDIRSLLGGLSSSVSSEAFERLRQDNVIRLARKRGTAKFYRLTPAALAENDAWLQQEHTT